MRENQSHTYIMYGAETEKEWYRERKKWYRWMKSKRLVSTANSHRFFSLSSLSSSSSFSFCQEKKKYIRNWFLTILFSFLFNLFVEYCAHELYWSIISFIRFFFFLLLSFHSNNLCGYALCVGLVTAQLIWNSFIVDVIVHQCVCVCACAWA